MATATHLVTEKEATAHPPGEAVVVRFAGDSGDGMPMVIVRDGRPYLSDQRFPALRRTTFLVPLDNR